MISACYNMHVKSKAGSTRPRKKRPGRPRSEIKTARLVTYVDERVGARARKLAREEGFTSVSGWASWVLTAAARGVGPALSMTPSLRSGRVPSWLRETRGPRDGASLLRRALQEERDRSP